MIDEPIAPGAGLPVYQPATVMVDGTWSAPVEVRPRWMSRARTPITGMVIETGGATWSSCGGGGVWACPTGGSTGLGAATCGGVYRPWYVTVRPMIPPARTARPTA